MAEWAPFAIRRDGPAHKFGGYAAGTYSSKRGEVKHSAEGYWPGLYSQLDGPTPVSWHFTVGFDRTEQHYPLSANCWHGGDSDNDQDVRANIDLIGIEHLGLAGEVLTNYQVDMTVQITKWAAEQFGLSTYARFPSQQGVWTMAEHNQVGNLPTSCPSGRIPWSEILALLTPLPPDEPVYIEHDLGALGATLSTIARRKRVIWSIPDVMAEILNEDGSHQDPPQFVPKL